MPNRQHRAAWLVYLNGIEVPCPEVTVSFGVWQIPEATLSFPPHRLLQRLGAEDRLEVVIFYLDDLLDPAKPEFRLLFEGEISGWSYTNSPFGRMMQFTARADISILEKLYFFYMNNVDMATAYSTEANVARTGAHANLFFPASLFYKGLHSARTLDEHKKPLPDITYPYQLLENAIRGMTNTDPQTATIANVNFYNRWVRKRNFLNRMAAMPLIEDPNNTDAGIFPIYKSVQAAGAVQAMREAISPAVGESGSVYAVLQDLFTKAYTELAMIPTAPALRVRLEDGVIVGKYLSTQAVIPTEPMRLLNHFAKPQMLFAVPPMCNVIFPAEIRSLTYQENYADQPTRVYINDGFVGSILSQNYFSAAALRYGYPKVVNATVQNALTGRQKNSPISPRALHNSKNLLIYPEEFYKGPIISQMPLSAWFSLIFKHSQSTAVKKDGLVTVPGMQELFEKYAEYEYFKQRYSFRGGTIDLVWDPYVVPGFPCVTFDQRVQGLDTVGYLTQVTHHLSARGKGSGTMRTSVSYSHGRTLWEALDLANQTSRETETFVGNAPPDPLKQIGDLTQRPDSAETLYRNLFFGPGEAMPKAAAFDYTKVLGFIPEEDAIKGATRPQEFSTKPSEPLDPNIRIEPKAPFDQIFADYDSAMALKSRPICTLEEYIRFRNNGGILEDLVKAKVVELPEDRYGPRYWGKILELTQGPAAEDPTPAMMGVDPANEDTVVTGPSLSVPPDFPQTRDNWKAILLAYREDLKQHPFQE